MNVVNALLTFYDYPAEHWKHVRTSSPIESPFATVRYCTKRIKGGLSRKTGLAMAFKLMMSAQKKWCKLDGQNRLPEINLSFATVSVTFKSPPDQASPTFVHICGDWVETSTARDSRQKAISGVFAARGDGAPDFQCYLDPQRSKRRSRMTIIGQAGGAAPSGFAIHPRDI
ncbi:hypothetical protein DT23_14735 [Thioclava indica]|uniref:Mutator family transposase n=1 Tax=Thioclava indica TaxID=1353528 RepID=A0A074JWT6_9RHOB|nr:hypothetical protein DT23_14735 [Thioclava indica]